VTERLDAAAAKGREAGKPPELEPEARQPPELERTITCVKAFDMGI
jgi:hypothetical protein